MIIYDLQCAEGHQFEGWFDDGDAYEAQRESNLIACPVCNDANVTKVPSTFAIKGASSQNRGGQYPAGMEMIGRSQDTPASYTNSSVRGPPHLM